MLDRGARRLYLHRYWSYEADLAAWIRTRAAAPVEAFDRAAAAAALERLFPASAGGEGPDWQKVAAVAALLRRFCVVTGGPGTGKTTVAGRILDLLAAVHGGISAVLAAPTGKAADRLAQAIGRRAGTRSEGGTTVHRLLYELRSGRARPPDVVVLDEASMADIALLASLVRLLSHAHAPPAARRPRPARLRRSGRRARRPLRRASRRARRSTTCPSPRNSGAR